MSSSSADILRNLNSEQKRLALKAWPFILSYLLLSSAPYILLDINSVDEAGAYFWAGSLGWALGYILLVLVMQMGGFFASGKASGVGTYFALGIAAGIPIALALVVFVLPGVYLLMRWLPVYARALTSPDRIGKALRWSWNSTEQIQKPLSIAMFGPVLFYAISAGSLYLYNDSSWTAYYVSSVAANLAASVAIAWLTVLGVATFSMVTSAAARDGQADRLTDPA